MFVILLLCDGVGQRVSMATHVRRTGRAVAHDVAADDTGNGYGCYLTGDVCYRLPYAGGLVCMMYVYEGASHVMRPAARPRACHWFGLRIGPTLSLMYTPMSHGHPQRTHRAYTSIIVGCTRFT